MVWNAFSKSLMAGLMGILLLSQMLAGFAQELDMDDLQQDQVLKPLVDTSSTSGATTTFQENGQSSSRSFVLSGKVQTLQEAIVSEKDTVDWYAWYLACRDYLSRTGGLQCQLGTSIKFHKNGNIEAMTTDPICLLSIKNRRFDLPKHTVLDALILPVRNGHSPPASPSEIYSRIEANQQ